MIPRNTITTYLEAKDIIMQVLREICLPHTNDNYYEHNATAIIARLAKADLVIYHTDEIDKLIQDTIDNNSTKETNDTNQL